MGRALVPPDEFDTSDQYTALAWRFTERRDGETATFEICGLSVRVEDAQRGRARIALANALVRATCSDDVADTLRGYEAERLMEKLCAEKGYRVTIIAAGGEDS